MSCQSRFDARYWMLGASALRQPRGMVWGGKREEGSGWGTHVYLWRIHFNIWQNQYNSVKFKNKIKKNKTRNMLLLTVTDTTSVKFSTKNLLSPMLLLCYCHCLLNIQTSFIYQNFSIL